MSASMAVRAARRDEGGELRPLPLPQDFFEAIPELEELGARAFTTTRAFGSFGMQSGEPVGQVMARWHRLQEALGAERFATARQVHGAEVVVHGTGWAGWLRAPAADGHIALRPGTAMAVTIADCVPVFVVHRSGAAAVLHSGWRGTEARIVERAIARFVAEGIPAAELVVATGPAICGACYEVSPDVYGRLTGRSVEAPATVDLRALIAAHARAAGVRRVVTSERCTKCDNAQFYSHRVGDEGRQLGVLHVPA